MSIIEFLLQRIAEDEEIARRAREATAPIALDDSRVGGLGSPSREAYYVHAAHITRYDPARVLAECQAKRRIVDEAMSIVDPEPGDDPYATIYRLDDEQVQAFGTVLHALAAVYADHPDYRGEWRP